MTKLIGTWHLIERDCNVDGAYHSHPFGADAQGTLTYTPQGQMSAILTRAKRPYFVHADEEHCQPKVWNPNERWPNMWGPPSLPEFRA